MSYLIVGHTHADVDALIGTIVSHLRNVDQMSPEEFAEEVGKACNSPNGMLDGIENSLSTPDFEKNFKKDRLSASIDGLAECREIRLSLGGQSANDSPNDVHIHYKVDSSKPGWLPRPAPISRRNCPHAWDMFKAMHPNAGQLYSCLPSLSYII